jgi:hypothetical protein
MTTLTYHAENYQNNLRPIYIFAYNCRMQPAYKLSCTV